MKVAFWSNSSGRAGTTSNMACMSILCAMLERKRTIMFENHYNLNDLEQAFIQGRDKRSNLLKEELSYYDPRGMEGLIRRVHSNYTYKDIMEDVSLKFLDNLLYYLPKSSQVNHEYFEFELNQVIKQLLALLNHSFDLVFIDTAPSHMLSTKLILEASDLVVVNLCQNKTVLDHFFSNYQSLIEKSVFLVGNYQEQSQYNLSSIRRRYQISKEKLGAVPFNFEFSDAISSGTAVEYVMRNLSCKRQDENYFFMSEVKKSAAIILKYLGEGKEAIVL